MTAIPILAQPVLQSQASWVTPQEQLDRLEKCHSKPIAYEISREPIYRTEMGDIANPGIAKIISQCAVVDTLSPSLTNWHTALQRSNALPDKIPPLPWNIEQILNSKCPIFCEERKPNETHYKVEDTHSLYLDPFPTINALEASVNVYGQSYYPHENPLRIQRFWAENCRRAHGNVEFEPQWILISNNVLPDSRKKSYEEQAQMVADLSKEAFVNYEVPSLKAAIAASFLHKVATGASLYTKGDSQSYIFDTYTRVQETIGKQDHMAVGAFAPSGLDVNIDCMLSSFELGVAVVRKF